MPSFTSRHCLRSKRNMLDYSKLLMRKLRIILGFFILNRGENQRRWIWKSLAFFLRFLTAFSSLSTQIRIRISVKNEIHIFYMWQTVTSIIKKNKAFLYQGVTYRDILWHIVIFKFFLKINGNLIIWAVLLKNLRFFKL